jgi:hypothetical protein
MIKKILIGTLIVATNIALAETPKPGLNTARTAASALGFDNQRPVFDSRGQEILGPLASQFAVAVTGARVSASDKSPDFEVSIRNPCSTVAGTEKADSAQFNCALTVKHASTVTTFKYTSLVTHTGTDSDGSAHYDGVVLGKITKTVE